MSYLLTRHKCYTDLENMLSEHDGEGKKCLSISGSTNLCSILGLSKCTINDIEYPHINMAATPFEDNSLDFIVADFVIEHVKNDPASLFKEQFRILKPGGHLVVTSNFVYIYHPCPKDYWRFSTDTYDVLCEYSGLETVKRGYWGSIGAMNAIHDGHSDWVVDGSPNNYLNNLAEHQDDRYQIVTWLCAKKPTT